MTKLFQEKPKDSFTEKLDLDVLSAERAILMFYKFIIFSHGNIMVQMN